MFHERTYRSNRNEKFNNDKQAFIYTSYESLRNISCFDLFHKCLRRKIPTTLTVVLVSTSCAGMTSRILLSEIRSGIFKCKTNDKFLTSQSFLSSDVRSTSVFFKRSRKRRVVVHGHSLWSANRRKGGRVEKQFPVSLSSMLVAASPVLKCRTIEGNPRDIKWKGTMFN